ncbi:hypothetical protein B0O80DRAFT_441475 [Mortierella sp. GBAus27b]|nr:hypothetical protein B0O80DRAFT_441475 [Mortierella sp. GBAus27b]
MALTIKKLADTSTEDLEFIKEKQIQRLTIDSTPLSSDKSRLTEILWSSNELRHLRINCDTRSSHSSTKGSEMTIQDLVTIVPSRTINQVESLEIHRGGFILATSSGTGIRNVSLKVVQLSNLNSEDLKFVQRRQLTRLEIQQFSHADKSRLADILKNCTMIVNLHIRCKVEYRRTNIIEMKLHDLVNIATSNATSKFESLTIEYDDLSMTASVLQGRLQDVKLTISKLCDLTSDAFDFMQREHLVQLSIKYTPMKDDDNQLCSIISRVPSLSQLRIGSKADRSLQLIELVMQHRSRVLQETGSCGLAEFDLMEENLVAFNPLDSHDYENHVQSQIKFYDGLHTFDMNTRIRLDRYYLSISKAIQAIISQFGWSIQFFDGGIGNHVNDFANLNSKTPYLRTLRGAIFWNSFSYVKQIIERSPRFQDLGLHLDVAASGGFEIAQELLDQYKAHLSCLLLFNGRYDERWSWFASQFPTRQSFPILESFELIPRSSYRLPSKCIPWIVAMISAAPPALDLSPQGTARREVSNDEPSVIRTWTSLKKITLEKLTLRPEEWTSVVKAIDFSMLEVLSFRKSNISVADFKLLVDRIPDGDPSTAPLKILNIRATTADGNAVAHSFFAEIHRKAPSARVCIS